MYVLEGGQGIRKRYPTVGMVWGVFNKDKTGGICIIYSLSYLFSILVNELETIYIFWRNKLPIFNKKMLDFI